MTKAKVRVNQDKCNGEALCLDLCPANVFEIRVIYEERKSIPIRENNCIVCMICEVNCPSKAITVKEL